MYFKIKKNHLLIFCLSLIIIFILGILLIPNNQNEIYLNNYLIDFTYLLISYFILGFSILKNKYDFFSPTIIFSFLYLTMFFVTPMYDILCEEYLWFGVDLFKFGIKGSTIAFVGYLSFMIFNNLNVPSSKQNKINIKYEYYGKKIVVFIVSMYVVCFIANVYYLTRSNSILYIFTLGVLGSGGFSVSDANLGAISMFSYALPSITLLYMEYGNNKFLKFVFFSAMFVLQVARGFRFFIIQIIIMFFSYYILKSGKKLKIRDLISIAICILIPTLLMTLFRNTIRSGSGMDLSIISLDVIKKAFDKALWDNFRIYKTYYGLIKAVPNLTNYLFGAQMIIYTMIMFIPRMLWKGKPSNPGTEAQRLGINQYAVDGGSAYPGLGEYYYDSGLFGVIMWSSILGWWLKKVYIKYRIKSESVIDLMIYSTILGIILQLVIRGYTPSNFWMIVFCMLPYWFIKRFFKKKVIERNE